MGHFPGAGSSGAPKFPGVEPFGLETAAVESLTGYVVRVGNAFAVPPRVLFAHALESAFTDYSPGTAFSGRTRTYARTANGAGHAAERTARAIRLLTGSSETERLSSLGVARMFGFGERGLLASRRRWCAECWREDEEPYDRKLWWLAVVDACPVHRCLLQDRCDTCGRTQQSLTDGVRLAICSFCGHPLAGDAIRLDESRSADRRILWYAREGALATLAAEVMALTGADVSEEVKAGYDRLETEARKRGLETAARTFERYRRGQGHRDAWLEGLFSVLWRMDGSVLELLPPSVRGPVREAELSVSRSTGKTV